MPPAAKLLFALVAVTLAMICGCKKSDTAGEPVQEVRLGYFANVTHAQAVLGVSSGDFEKAVAPAKFTTKVFNAGPSLIEALFAGEVDIGYIGPGPALNGFTKSKGKVKVIAGSAGSGVLIVARKDSGIMKLQDLAGKKVATPQLYNTQDIAARHFLSEMGKVAASGIKPIPNGEQAGSMSRGEIDAAWAPEPWGSYLISETGATLIAEERSLWPQKDFAITVVITTPEFLSKHPDVVEKVLGVHATWTDRLRTEPDRWLPNLESALVKLSNKKLPAGVLKAAVGRTTFSDDPLEYTFEQFALWSYQQGAAKEAPDLSGLVDTSIMKKVRSAQPQPATVR